MKPDVQIKMLLRILSQGVYEKEHIIAMALLSAIAGESIFLLGPPGTAKSLVARRLKLAFKDGIAFEYLMSRFSTPDEIFGPVSISLLKNEDRYERVVDGFLPTATIVFLDEIWKASPSIQNALLTAINERIFQNGRDTISLPMKALIAASNELPAEDEGLEALWDRFLVRMVSNCIQTEATFYKMIRQQSFETPTVDENCQITEDDYRFWQQEISMIDIPEEICAVITSIRKGFKEEAKKEEVNEMDYYISDRRWKKCVHLMQASAYLNGRKSIDITDIPILIHCLWNKAETIPTTIDVIGRSLTAAIDTKLEKLEKDIEQALKKISEPQKEEQNNRNMPETFSLTHYIYYTLRDFKDGKCFFYKADYNHVSVNKPSDGIIYRDDEKRAWIIHAIYTGTPFDYKVRNQRNIKKIKLQKCKGGIIIDGTPYGFEKPLGTPALADGLFNNELFPAPNIADSVIEVIDKELRPQHAKLQDMFAKSKNLFLSVDDLKVTKKYLTMCNKRIEELYVKAQNAQKLL